MNDRKIPIEELDKTRTARLLEIKRRMELNMREHEMLLRKYDQLLTKVRASRKARNK